MSRAPLFLGLLAVLIPACAMADELQISPHADLLYRQALTLMDKADDRYSGYSMKTSASDPKLATPGQSLGRSQAPAVSLLKKAAELEHPVARYRLALHYIDYLPANQIPAAACPLLQASLAQGFAAAAMGIEDWCVDYRQSSAYAKDLANIQARINRYTSYYPQPAVSLPCNREQPHGLAMQWGRQRDFQAEIYRIQGNDDPQKREYYWQKAVELNGCFAARRGLLGSHH